MNAPELIKDLMAAGKTQAEIADAIGASQSSISSYLTRVRGAKRGLPYDVMVRLLALHGEVCSKPARAA